MIFQVDNLSGPLLDVATAEAIGYSTSWSEGEDCPSFSLATGESSFKGAHWPCELSSEYTFGARLMEDYNIQMDSNWQTPLTKGRSMPEAACKHVLKLIKGETVEIRDGLVQRAGNIAA